MDKVGMDLGPQLRADAITVLAGVGGNVLKLNPKKKIKKNPNSSRGLN